LQSKLFYFIRPDLVAFYEEGHTKLEDEFSDYHYDAEEAGKCLALGRYTACVFHLMRIWEVYNKRIKDALGITKQINNWGMLVQEVSDAIDGQYEKDKDATKRAEWRSVLNRIVAVKDAWRNKTMHIEIGYNEESARDVYRATERYYEEITKLLGK